jgi:hypothetical protein
MANAIYPKAKESMLAAGINMSSGTVKAALVDTGTYTYSATHDFYNDVSGVVGTPQAITTKTFTDGVFDGDNVTYTALTGNTVEAIIIFIDTGTPTTSALIAYLDTGYTNLPFTPNGGDVTIQWDGGANRIFKL